MSGATSGDGGPETSPPRRSWALRIALGLLVSGAIVALLLTQVDLARVKAVLLGVSPAMFALGLGVYSVLTVVRAWRFRVLLPEARPSSLIAIAAVHLLLLRVMPMRTGELGFAWLMRRSGDAGFTQSLVGLFLMRVLDLATVLVFYAASLALFDPGGGRSIVVGAVAVAGVLVAIFVRPALGLAHRIADRVVLALHLERFARIERVRGSLAGAVEWSLSLPRIALARATLLTLVQWVLSFLFAYVLALAMQMDVTLPQAILGAVGTIVGSMLPIPGIGTFGPLEAGWAAGFALTGVSSEEAIATAFGYSVISFVYSAITALPGWLWLSFTAPRGGDRAPPPTR